MRVVRVALDVPLPTLFDYHAPADAPVTRRPACAGPLRPWPQGGRGPGGRCRAAGGARAHQAARPCVPRRAGVGERRHRAAALQRRVLPLSRRPGGDGRVSAAACDARGCRRRPTFVSIGSRAAGHAFELSSLPQRAVLRRRLLTALREAPSLDLPSARALSPAAPRALAELERMGLIERVHGADAGAGAPFRAGDQSTFRPCAHAGPGAQCARHPGWARSLRSLPPPGRDRQRQNRGLLRGRRRGAAPAGARRSSWSRRSTSPRS